MILALNNKVKFYDNLHVIFYVINVLTVTTNFRKSEYFVSKGNISFKFDM